VPFLGTRGAGTNKAFGFAGPGKPNQVTGLTATDFGTARQVNDGRIDLSWTAPANNGATISGYKIERSTDNIAYSTIVPNTGTTATTYSSTTLNSAQIYYYKVSAINAAGTGDASAAASATATTVPAVPTIGTATCATGQAYTGSANVSVPFTPGTTGGKTVTYNVTSSSTATGSNSASPVTVSETVGNPTSTARTYTVIATNANGSSVASSASNSVAAISVPQAPTIGTATGGNASATVAYTANATGGATVSTFTATSSPGSLTGTGSSPITVSGLTNGTAYTFTVRATNSSGNSNNSSASNSVTPAIPTDFESIATFTPTSGAVVTFSSIPQTYKSLQVRVNCVATGGINNSVYMRLNGATSGYTTHALYGASSTVTAADPYGANTSILPIHNGPQGNILTYPMVSITDIIDYSSTAKNTTIRTFHGQNQNDTGGYNQVSVSSGLWNSTAAVTSLTVNLGGVTFAAGTSIALYGVK
jgi:hypothetical protein